VPEITATESASRDALAIGGLLGHANVLIDIRTGAARERRRYRISYALTWVVIVGALISLLYAAGKIDPQFIVLWAPYILGGVPTTLLITVVSISLAMVIALVGALGRLAPWAPVNAAASLYVSLVRGTPLIVQLLFFYLALPQLIPASANIPVIALGIFALAFNYGAYMTEIFRAGIQAVPRGQVEAAYALGMSPSQTFTRIVLPQAFKIVIPPIGNDFIGMIKDSALVSIITVQELLWRAQLVGQMNFRSLETLLVAAAVYWTLTLIFSAVQVRIERRLAQSGT
jgi:polar amino acid transport system permease protein